MVKAHGAELILVKWSHPKQILYFFHVRMRQHERTDHRQGTHLLDGSSTTAPLSSYVPLFSVVVFSREVVYQHAAGEFRRVGPLVIFGEQRVRPLVKHLKVLNLVYMRNFTMVEKNIDHPLDNIER